MIIRYPLIALALIILSQTGVQAQASELFTVEQNGTRSGSINLVFLSEGYTVADLPTFAGHVDNAVAYLFSREPWNRYRPYFNIYRIEIASNESGADNGAAGGQRDTYFNSGFNSPTIARLLTLNAEGKTRAYALLNKHVAEYDIPFVLVNEPTYGGAGGAISTASTHHDSAQLVEHEIGHSYAGLADEYETPYPGWNPTEKYNTTQQSNRDLVRWKSWIEDSTPVLTPKSAAFNDVVGVFEGAQYQQNGWFRPHYNSMMRNLGKPVGAVNREKIVLTYYEKVSPVAGYMPSSLALQVNRQETLKFSVTPRSALSKPGIAFKWQVDGVALRGEIGSDLLIPSNEIGNGNHTVSAVVSDATPWVRDDPDGLLNETVTWTVNLNNQAAPVTLELDPSSRSITAAGGYGNFSVSSNTAWSWSDNASWLLSREKTGQSGNQLFSYYVKENASTKARTATITLSAGTINRTHTLTQAAIDPDADSDNDGWQNGDELKLGTSPFDAADTPVFKLTAAITSPRNEVFDQFTISFPTSSTKSYTVEVSTDLKTWTNFETGIAGTGALIKRSYPIRGALNRFGFFRARQE